MLHPSRGDIQTSLLKWMWHLHFSFEGEDDMIIYLLSL